MSVDILLPGNSQQIV